MIYLSEKEQTECNKIVQEEMDAAEIETIQLGGRPENRIMATIMGKCNNFIFIRSTYYWIVEGHLPLEDANFLFDNYHDLKIRVRGNHEDVKPIEWAFPRNYDEDLRKYINSLKDEHLNLSFREKLKVKHNELINNSDALFVTMYHIDTQEGLNLFVKYIKEHDIKG